MPGAFVYLPSPVSQSAPYAPSVPSAGSAPSGQVYPWSLRGEPDDSGASHKHDAFVDLNAGVGAASHRYVYLNFVQSCQAYPLS